MKLSEIRKTVEKLREQPITLPDANMALYPVPTVMYLAQHAIDIAAENERLKSKLDAVRKWASNPVRIDDFGYQMAQESVLSIIDKDGEDA